ncbi:hypothetical protein [Flavobacterium sp. N1994]|uniref:hypothetical protein n=1 Tax=Flavobacterium sp. N1994 TaxID=2986827 RepID=UPI002222DC44|nr:hypothetical protein [Flavobacterium sp. N1994]
MQLTEDQLKKIMPQARMQLLEMFLAEFQVQFPKYQIDTPLRLAAFLAQGGT